MIFSQRLPNWSTGKINPRPVGVGLVTHPVGGGPFWPPPEISRTTPRSDKRKTALDSPRRELPVACIFFENRGHGSGQTEVKGQIWRFYIGVCWGLRKLETCFILSGRSSEGQSMILKGSWVCPKQRSGQGQVTKGQVSSMSKSGHTTHVFRSFFDTNWLVMVCNVHLRCKSSKA